ncbi:two-component system chemotaxis sensor kinase CheA [Palleronia aestuarii]|uniref:Chemotaxis protein CheA n=1 Tax=Palleronia aestuarii TaxID=568105 RepID=A0A2W7MTD9_9RHOB|nr:chemotaxis protein CheA [Palleronia aestuarii]PZX11355.1 two-component system chemotaxis sensor kinase CheA [Palleronia aestuarii]
MSSLNEIRQMFFVECEEQLEQLTDGLDTLQEAVSDGEQDSETVNTIFRAVHSIKGGAASFSLDAITRFAHIFETILDEVRGNQQELTPDLLREFYGASDYLAELVAQGAEGEETDEAVLDERTERIAALSAADGDEGETDFSEAFVPVSLDFGFEPPEGVEGPQSTGFSIRFVPTPELYANGHEPLHLFRELETLGSLTVEAVLDEAAADEADPATPHLSWSLALEADCDEGQIREIFEFAEPYAELEIMALEPAAPAFDLSAFEAPSDDEEGFVPFSDPGSDADLGAEPSAETSSPPIADTPPGAAEPAAEPAPDAPKPAPEEKKSAAKAGPKATVRVDLDLVDDLINTVGELVITQSVVTQSIQEAGVQKGTRLAASLEEFRNLTRHIQEGVMAIRAQSVKPLFQRMGRIVRETAQIAGKDVRFVTTGEDTEVDRTVIERLVDPLTHILRNAIDHGLETAETRIAAGKEPQGTVTLSAAHRSGRVVIEVADNGGGINREKVLASAISKGLVAENAVLGPAEIDRLLFTPGFSTASAVTSLSGRGVGMDVVNSEIKRLGGRVSILSTPGQGSTISISLPLTLAVLDGMVVDVAGETLVVPISSIAETIRPQRSQIEWADRRTQMINLRNIAVPIIDLGQVFGYSDVPAMDRDGVLLLVEDDQGAQRALAVDSIHDQRQVVIKSLESNYGHVPCVAAATILGDGRIALIVDVDEINHRAAAVGTVASKEVLA